MDPNRSPSGVLQRVMTGSGPDPIFRGQIEDFILQHGYVKMLELTRDCAQTAILRITQETMNAVHGALHSSTFSAPPPAPEVPRPQPAAAPAAEQRAPRPPAPTKKRKRGRPKGSTKKVAAPPATPTPTNAPARHEEAGPLKPAETTPTPVGV